MNSAIANWVAKLTARLKAWPDGLFAVGPLTVSKSPPELEVMEKTFTEVKPGGKGCPTNCTARHRVAIIIPFRDRPKHLQTLLYNLHPMLLRQQIDYQIFVIEQKGENLFRILRFFDYPSKPSSEITWFFLYMIIYYLSKYVEINIV